MEIETQECYLCNTSKPLKEFIKRKDGIYYRMCKDCNNEVQKKKLENPGKKLKHTDSHRTCYKCMRFLENKNFTKRATGTFFLHAKNVINMNFNMLEEQG